MDDVVSNWLTWTYPTRLGSRRLEPPFGCPIPIDMRRSLGAGARSGWT